MKAQPAPGFLVTLEAMDADTPAERPVPVLSQVLLVEVGNVTNASRLESSKTALQASSGLRAAISII